MVIFDIFDIFDMRKITAFVVSSVVLAGCGEYNDNIFDAPVRKATAEKTCTLDGTPVELGEEKPEGIRGIFTCDSTLFLRGKVKDSPYMIHEFSLSDGIYKGSYIAKGRGEKELLSPRLESCVNGGIYIFDLNLCSSYRFDYKSSEEAHDTELSRLVKLPGRTLYSYPIDDKHFSIGVDEDDYVGNILDEKGNVQKRISLYPHVSAQSHFDRLSASGELNEGRKKLALAMLMLPQVNFLDLDTEDRITSAVSDKYKDWKESVNGDDKNRRIYYLSSTQSSEYYMTLYVGGSTVIETANGVAPHLHVFDWDGRLLYDVALKEKIGSIAFDESSGMLYGVDSNDEIWRYDLSELTKS